MKDSEIIERLRQWDEEEMIYREVHQALHGQMAMVDVLRHWPGDHRILQIALDPTKYPRVVSADYLLKADRSVAISKHPRYCRMPLHKHDYFELNYVLCGDCVQHFEDTAAALSAGDICLLSPDVGHWIEAFDDDVIVLNLAIRRSSFLNRFPTLPRRESAISSFFMGNLYSKRKLRYLLAHSGEDEEIRHQVLQMYGEEMDWDVCSDDLMTSRMTLLFSLLLHDYCDRMEAPPLRQTQNPVTYDMLGYIHEHHAEVTLQQVADAFHFSRQYCSRLISDLTGCSFSELLTRFRVQQGEELLVNSFMSVEEIGERVGYADPETFIRAFRKIRGVTPGQLRRQVAANATR